MTRFLTDTLTDIRGGRDSWRVITIASAVAFIVAIAVNSAHLM
jgi:anti-sigma-K factor RskA